MSRAGPGKKGGLRGHTETHRCHFPSAAHEATQRVPGAPTAGSCWVSELPGEGGAHRPLTQFVEFLLQKPEHTGPRVLEKNKLNVIR